VSTELNYLQYTYACYYSGNVNLLNLDMNIELLTRGCRSPQGCAEIHLLPTQRAKDPTKALIYAAFGASAWRVLSAFLRHQGTGQEAEML
jgi:hypothetical protein